METSAETNLNHSTHETHLAGHRDALKIITNQQRCRAKAKLKRGARAAGGVGAARAKRSFALRHYVNISTLQLFAFARQRGEMLQGVPGEARRRAQITQNSIFQFSEIYHFFDLSSTPWRRTNSLISLALSQTTPSSRSFTYQSLEILF